MFSSFEGRLKPGYLFTIIPKPILWHLFLVLPVGMMVLLADGLQRKAFCAGVLVFLCYRILDTWRGYSDQAVKPSRKKGKEMFIKSSFAALKKQPGPQEYKDYFGWKTSIETADRFDQAVDCIVHHDGSVSLMFEWEGVRDLSSGEIDFTDEHKRRVAMLKGIRGSHALFVEHHFVRSRDVQMVDAYELEGRIMFDGQEMPPIVADCRKGIADICRANGRGNRVFVVFSMNGDTKKWFGLLPSKMRRNRGQAEIAEVLAGFWSEAKSFYPGARLCDRTEHSKVIQLAKNPMAEPTELEWRYSMHSQIVPNKPEWNEKYRCLALENGAYCAPVLMMGYPKMPLNWPHTFATAATDIHVAQILCPKDTQASLDETKKQIDQEAGTLNERRSSESFKARKRDVDLYANYVTSHNLPVVDNAFVITFFSHSPERVNQYVQEFAQATIKEGGIVKADRDVQMDMYRTRLPGLGRGSLFLREDHGDTVAAMMPFTTLSHGAKAPESIRLGRTGNIIGVAPSKQEVLGEMIVAKTGGGKDTNFGLKILETYPRVRYDLIEYGSTYQGIIEAIGGNYCKARDQVINPLMSWSDFKGSVERQKRELNHDAKINNALLPQQVILEPIFKGLRGEPFTKSEGVVMIRALRWVYQNQPGAGDAPTLPLIEEALNQIDVEFDRYAQARDLLGESLVDFLNSAQGSAFREQDQFIISPIANAIDFDRMPGDLAEYFMTFTAARLMNNAFASGKRNQLVLNEYKVMLERSPDMVRRITLAVDRMGRKDAVGLTRISQGFDEIANVDSEALNAIESKTLLYRGDQHDLIAEAMRMPEGMLRAWKGFESPNELRLKNYREAIIEEGGEWHHLLLMFPKVGLQLMDTRAETKGFREEVFAQVSDPYERIKLVARKEAERTKMEEERKGRHEKALA